VGYTDGVEDSPVVRSKNRRRAARQQRHERQRELEDQQLVLPWILNNWLFTVVMRKLQSWVGPESRASSVVLVVSALIMLAGFAWAAMVVFC